MGQIERNIARQAYRDRKPLPDRIQNAPQLIDGLEFYIDAFFELDSERSHAVGITPIPWTSINAYAQRYSLEGEDFEDLVFFVRQMDGANIDRLEKKTKAKNSSSKKVK